MLFGWLRKRREAHAEEAKRAADNDAWEAWQQAKLADPAWRRWDLMPPPSDEIVEYARYEWPTSHIGRGRDLHPAMNVANLWWRSRASDVVIEGRVLDLEPSVVSRPLSELGTGKGLLAELGLDRQWR